MGGKNISEERGEHNGLGDVEESMTEAKGFADSYETAYSEDGVDLTLIRWMLSLTPTERLRVLQDNILSVQRLKNAGIRSANHKAPSDA